MIIHDRVLAVVVLVGEVVTVACYKELVADLQNMLMQHTVVVHMQLVMNIGANEDRSMVLPSWFYPAV